MEGQGIVAFISVDHEVTCLDRKGIVTPCHPEDVPAEVTVAALNIPQNQELE